MNKAYKFRIYPNAEQKVLFAKTFGCVRFLYNRMLADKIKYYEETKQKLNNTPAQYKKEFEWLKEVDSLALANAQMNLQAAYNNFFRSPKVGFPKFKSKKCNRRSYTTNCVTGNIKLENGYSDVLPPLSLSLRSGGFLFDTTFVVSISKLSPCIPRFFIFYFILRLFSCLHFLYLSLHLCLYHALLYNLGISIVL